MRPLEPATRRHYIKVLHAEPETSMNAPISIRLDDEVRIALEAEAKACGLGLATYLRQLAAADATRLKRERIRAASEAVGRHVSASAEAKAFADAWGTPLAEGLEGG